MRITGKGVNRRMSLPYIKQVIVKQVKEGQNGFSYQMYDSYKKHGGRLSYASIIKNVDKFHKENALYGLKHYNK